MVSDPHEVGRGPVNGVPSSETVWREVRADHVSGIAVVRLEHDAMLMKVSEVSVFHDSGSAVMLR